MPLSDAAFQAIADLFRQLTGIRLEAAKRPLVEGRLTRLARELGHPDAQACVEALLARPDAHALARLTDRLTTHETHFFREPAHFDFLASWLPARAASAGAAARLRGWSAACASGEEAYSLAMVIADHWPGARWEVVGTDVSPGMVETARAGMYPIEQAARLTPARLRRWCLRGRQDREGWMQVGPALRAQVAFRVANLMAPPEELGTFDVILLRNVLMYFDPAAQAALVRAVLGRLAPGGVLCTGHAESIAHLDLPPLQRLAPAVHRLACRPGAGA